MINFRYHVVSLIAVFLALGMGILIGSSFIAEVTVQQLRETQERLNRTNEELRRDLRAGEHQTNSFEQFVGRVAPRLIQNRLTDQRVLVLGFESTDPGLIDPVVRALIDSGAQLEGVILLSDRLDLSTQARQQQVGLALETPPTDEETLRGVLVERLGESLSAVAHGLFARLGEHELVRSRNIEGVPAKPLDAIPEPGSILVFLSPGDAAKAKFSEDLLVPLIGNLEASGVIVAVCEEGNETLAFLAPIRRNSGAGVLTVDGIEGPMGMASLVLGIEAALGGSFAHYGTGSGSQATVPETPPPE